MSEAEDLLKQQFEIMIRKSARYKELDRYKTLKLNADYQPISYFPLSTMSWQEIMWLIVKGELTGQPRVSILEEYDEVVIRSPNKEYRLPSVVANLEYVPFPKRVPFTKFNVFLRDDFTCQYTGEKCEPEDLTFDHVIPESRGGKSVWENIVTAKRSINELKDARTPKEAGLRLRIEPYEPSPHEIHNKGRNYPPKYLHETWVDYLYWNSEIEP